MALSGLFALWFLIVFGLVLVPIGFTIYSLVDISRTPDAAFGPPWDNGKSAWTIGLAVAFVLPAGTIVGPVLWFTQGRSALRARQQVPRPFWSPRPTYPYPAPYPPQGYYPVQGQPGPPVPPQQQPPS